MVEVTEKINEVIELLDSRRFLHGHRETMKESLRIALEAALASPAEVVEPVVYIIKDVLSELRKHKDASGTVWSGLNTNHPFVKDAVPLYPHPPQQEPARLREALEHKQLIRERDLLRIALVRYGDKSRMGFVEPMELQQAIDAALAEGGL